MSQRRRDYEIYRKSLYGTVGAGLILYETSLDLLRDLITAGRIAPEEGRRIVDDVADRLEDDGRYFYRDTKEDGREKREHHQKDFATKEDINDLKAELAKLNQRLATQSAGTHPPES